MKNGLLILVLGLLLGSNTLSAQKTVYDFGPDSVSCMKNLFLFQEFVKQKAWSDAIDPWQKCVDSCPQSQKKLYTKGATMLKSLIKSEKDPAKKEELKQKLMDMYDTRIEAFGGKGSYLGKKGVAYYKYYPDDIGGAIAILKEAIDITKDKSSAATVSTYFSAIYNSFKKGETPVETLLNEYVRISDIINVNLTSLDPSDEKQARKLKGYTTAKENVDTYFIAVAECDDIVKLYEEKIGADPENLELNKKAMSVMSKKDCVDAPLFLQVSKFVHAQEPTWESAYAIGKTLLKQGKTQEALKMFEQAVELCGDCPDKATLLTSAGLVASQLGQTGKANGYANEMLKLNPNSGTAYLIKGDIARSKAKACDDGKAGSISVYWLAADYYSKAKKVDPSDKIKAAANKKLGICRSRYPTKEDLFFWGLTAGQSYKVPCTGETTTIRKSN